MMKLARDIRVFAFIPDAVLPRRRIAFYLVEERYQDPARCRPLACIRITNRMSVRRARSIARRIKNTIAIPVDPDILDATKVSLAKLYEFQDDALKEASL